MDLWLRYSAGRWVAHDGSDSDDVPEVGDAIFSSHEDVVQKGNDLKTVSRHSRVQCAGLVDDFFGFGASPKTHPFGNGGFYLKEQ